MSDPTATRRLERPRRIVVKLGTQVVTHADGSFALGRLHSVVEDIAALRLSGHEVVVVSSGAVGLGVRELGLQERPRSLGLRQACAAVGQGRLHATYTQAFATLGLVCAQVLLTQEDLADPDRALCVRTTLLRLLELGAVPILNENDSVSVRELLEWRRAHPEPSLSDRPLRDDEKEHEWTGLASPAPGRQGAFGDNDGLSARVAVALDCDLLVLLTDVDGLYDADPRHNAQASLIPELAAIDDRIRALAGGTSSRGGTGGMASKVQAAALASEAGTHVCIAPGHLPQVLARILAGEVVGTLVRGNASRRGRRRTIALEGVSRGALIIDDGAAAALRDRNASLLPVGVAGVEGTFAVGELIEVRDGSGRIIGRGLANYDSEACKLLAGKRSDDLLQTLGYRGYDALITRDNLALGEV